MKPLWDFSQHGQCGRWASTCSPKSTGTWTICASSTRCRPKGVAHGPATLFLHCGATNFIRPSMGSWVIYGLGSENENLPGFVSIAPSAGNGGPRNYGNAFLPAVYQGTAIGKAGGPASDLVIRNLANAGASADAAAAQLRPDAADERRAAAAASGRCRAGGGRQFLRTGRPDAGPCARCAGPVARNRPRRWRSTASATRRPTPTAANA